MFYLNPKWPIHVKLFPPVNPELTVKFFPIVLFTVWPLLCGGWQNKNLVEGRTWSALSSSLILDCSEFSMPTSLSQHLHLSIPTSASPTSGWVLCITFQSLISEALNRDSALALSNLTKISSSCITGAGHLWTSLWSLISAISVLPTLNASAESNYIKGGPCVCGMCELCGPIPRSQREEEERKVSS